MLWKLYVYENQLDQQQPKITEFHLWEISLTIYSLNSQTFWPSVQHSLSHLNARARRPANNYEMCALRFGVRLICMLAYTIYTARNYQRHWFGVPRQKRFPVTRRAHNNIITYYIYVVLYIYIYAGGTCEQQSAEPERIIISPAAFACPPHHHRAHRYTFPRSLFMHF